MCFVCTYLCRCTLFLNKSNWGSDVDRHYFVFIFVCLYLSYIRNIFLVTKYFSSFFFLAALPCMSLHILPMFYFTNVFWHFLIVVLINKTVMSTHIQIFMFISVLSGLFPHEYQWEHFKNY